MTTGIGCQGPMAGRVGGMVLVQAHPLRARAVLGITSVEGMKQARFWRLQSSGQRSMRYGGRQLGAHDGFRPIAYHAMFWASNQETLQKLRAAGVSKVAVHAADDSCESCKQLDAGAPYSTKRVPKVPNPDCTHPIGWCRCIYTEHRTPGHADAAVADLRQWLQE